MSGLKVTGLGRTRPVTEGQSVDGVDVTDGRDFDGGGALVPAPAPRDQWKQPVRVAATANEDLSTLADGDTVDGVVVATGDRVLLPAQTDDTENGIYLIGAAAGDTERAPDMDDDDEVLGAVVYVIDGSTNGGKAFRCDLIAEPVIGTDSITFAELSAVAATSFDTPAVTYGTPAEGTDPTAIRTDATLTAPELDELENVDTSGKSDGDVPIWDAGSSTWIVGAPSGVSDILDIPTAETDSSLVLAPDGAGGVEFRAEAGGGGSTGARYPVQEKSSGGSSATSHAVTLTATPTVGNLLILVSNSEGAQDITGISQTNVTWTLLAKSGAGVAPVVEIWKGVISASPGTGVTASYSGSAAFGSIVVSEWSGLSGTLDGSATTHTTSGILAQPIPLLTPTVATALVIAVICQGGFGTTYQAEYWSGSPLTMFASSKSATGNNVQGSFWGFPGATTVYGYGRNTNSNATQSALTVSIT